MTGMGLPGKFDWRSLPWGFIAVFVVAIVIALNPGWRDVLIYDRRAVMSGEFWRLWTGHLVHFGWPHLIADAGLLVIVGWPLAQKHPQFSWLALFLMPLFISGVLLWLDPTMTRYAGLSAVDLGLLLFLAAKGWQKNWTDWFWPAVLVIYVAEVVFEIVRGGQGGGMIAFDDPTVKVATSAHLAAAAYALLAWAAGRVVSIPTVLRYAIGAILICAGASALIRGVAYDGMLRGEGIPARLVGIGLLLTGILVVFKKVNLHRNDNEPPDFG